MKVKYKGAWILVDNGYLNWGTTVAPKIIPFLGLNHVGLNGLSP